MELPVDLLEALTELVDQLGEAVEVGHPPPFELGAAGLEVVAGEATVAALAESDHRLPERFLEVGIVECLPDALPEMAPALVR